MHFASQEWRFFWKRREAYRHLVNGITFTIWFIFVNGWKVCSSKPMQNFFSLHQSTKKYPLFSLQAFVFQLIDEINQLSPDPPPHPFPDSQVSPTDDALRYKFLYMAQC